MYPQSADLIRPGIGFEDMMRAAVQRGQFSVPRGEEEAWLEMRMALHRGNATRLWALSGRFNFSLSRRPRP